MPTRGRHGGCVSGRPPDRQPDTERGPHPWPTRRRRAGTADRAHSPAHPAPGPLPPHRVRRRGRAARLPGPGPGAGQLAGRRLVGRPLAHPRRVEAGAFRLGGELGHFLVNDALMTVFFFVVGLEVKRELAAGELRDPRKAALPVAAARGGSRPRRTGAAGGRRRAARGGPAARRGRRRPATRPPSKGASWFPWGLWMSRKTTVRLPCPAALQAQAVLPAASRRPPRWATGRVPTSAETLLRDQGRRQRPIPPAARPAA